MGKLRAAAGSSVSRSLFGAYPGDALPTNQAGNPHGLIFLAERYGYSDLQAEEDEEGFVVPAAFGTFKTTTNIPPSKKRHQPREDNENRFAHRHNTDSNSSSWNSDSRRKTMERSKTTFNTPPNQRMDAEREQRPKTGVGKSLPRPSSTILVRPAMERLDELRRKQKSFSQSDDSD